MQTEPIFMEIVSPYPMGDEETVRRAQKLIPCKTGEWRLEDSVETNQVGDRVLLGCMHCEFGFFDNNPNGGSYGPDDAGVSVNWEPCSRMK